VRPSLNGRRLGRVLGATLIAGGLVVSFAGVASAKVTADPVGPSGVVVSGVALAAYPTITPPPGCAAGEAFLTGTTYDIARGQIGIDAGAVNIPGATTLREGTIGRLYPGDTITMHWTGFGGTQCDGDAIGVSLAVKKAPSPTFDPGTDQALLLDFAYCGSPEGISGATSCESANNTLTLTLPGYDEACDYQIDAVIGGPLAVVGPGGSFYGSSFRPNGGPDMLITANNGGPEACTTVTKTVSVSEGATDPGDRDYLICLTPAGGAVDAVQDLADDVSCPVGAIAVVLKGGESKTIEVTPGTTYEISEVLAADDVRVLQPMFTPSTGENLVGLTNIFECADRGDTEQPSPTAQVGYTVVIDEDCTPPTTPPTIPTTPPTVPTTPPTVPTTPPTVPTTPPTVPTTPPTTPTTVATTVATTVPATTIAPATTAPSRGELPTEETVEGTTVTNPETLPVTGSSTWPAARIGIVMVLLGVAAVALTKRRSAQA
jgi:hypothetical protein